MSAWAYDALLLAVAGPIAMLACAFAGFYLWLAWKFLFDTPPRCPDCGDPMPTARGYAGERCPACSVVASVKGVRV